MIDEVRHLLDTYAAWVRDRSTLRQVNNWVEITTPYLDRHNDYIQIYVRRENDSFILTDDGYIITDLEQSGCNLDSPKRQKLLAVTLQGFGVHLNKKALEVRASTDTFPTRKHNLVQAMLAVNDMFYLASPMVASLFYEDVVAWLDLHDIRYTSRVKFSGKTGYDHLFDFVIPKSKMQPERILQTINRPNRDTAQSFAFAWIDTREVRPAGSCAYAFLNDAEHPITSGVLDALRNYDVTPVPWSERDDVREKLAA